VKILSSAQNSIIKSFLILQKKSKERKLKKLFVVEGKKEIDRAILGDYHFKSIFIREGSPMIFNKSKKIKDLFFIKKKLFDKMSIRSGSEKYLGIGISKNHDLNDLTFIKGTILIADSIEKPGNIGALLRTSSALGVSAFILSNQISDIYHPNVIRSSLGGVFNIPIFISDPSTIINHLKKNNINLISGTINEKSIPISKASFKKPCAILVGSESKGLSSQWIKNSSEIIEIPMKNNIDSLNVSVAAAILLHQSIQY
tara:strand:+ start:1943 stop:2713 length:771 start_codon:yes stop_codon:yes gene_type:complete